MGRKATSIDKQVELLKNRNMVLDWDKEKIKEILLDIGYYRLGFYWQPFEIDDQHNLEVGTKFSNIVNLYYLDVDLRNLLSKYINRIEINFRTKLVYYVSNKYKESPTWFVDNQVMSRNYIANFDKYYDEEFKRNNKPIKKHHEKYINDKYAPAWKTIEFFTFGGILKIFSSLKDDGIKERISNTYDIRDVRKFINFMTTIKQVRNVCAHSAVIFDFNTPRGINRIPAFSFNDNNRHSLDSSMKVIKYVLSQISGRRSDDMESDINNLFGDNSGNPVIKNIIESKMGYRY
ncbi:Abi family protein [Mesonia sp.]|uniref:Abi family protein n=1 Tax=Mesonia sp. TaxID=1960830 RepID=UPI000C8FAB4E|nr:Abi family protein [Mesonia sp.]MAN25813.1 DNA-binding protein [Mesonia sp.]|tara:strand:- start:1981 stop:2850 length:870 start_codon:yes stop_codon:yes gene_type:complete